VLGLYLHIPFCSAICNYCNFNRGLYDEALKRRYVDALTQEIRRAGRNEGPPAEPSTHSASSGSTVSAVEPSTSSGSFRAKSRADTIYFGGGTPSLLEAAEVASLIDACRTAFAISDDVEISLEANPETVTLERLEGFRAAGVNRLSFGVQSFRDEELKRLSRLHDSSRARMAYRWARQAGFENVSLDLMMSLPGQRLYEWIESVDALIELSPDHASLYMLELYPNAPLRDEMVRSRLTLAPEDEAAEMYLAGMARLDRAGYAQYEISNVARPGRQARHNLKYWTGGEWLGFGCGAHSTRGGIRWRNISATDEYVRRMVESASPTSERRMLPPSTQLEEALFMGLRMSEGVDLDALAARHGVDVWQRYGSALQPHLEAELLQKEGSRLRLTRPGMLLSLEVLAVFV
jgi:oxygen-independent coproporphyrinogen-3 oxidase